MPSSGRSTLMGDEQVVEGSDARVALNLGEEADLVMDRVVLLVLAMGTSEMRLFFGFPKSSRRAGLLRCDATKVLIVFSGEKMPSSFKMRRLVGLNKIGEPGPGDKGRLAGLADLKGLVEVLKGLLVCLGT